MQKSIWEWLEIEPTTDVDTIKKAYAEAAKKYHPTEHPEEFKKLRECFKAAIAYAKNDHGNGYYEEQMTSGDYFEEVKHISYEINKDDSDRNNQEETEEKFSYDISKKESEKEDEEKISFDINKQNFDGEKQKENEGSFSYDISKQESDREDEEELSFDLNKQDSDGEKQKENEETFSYNINKDDSERDDKENLSFNINKDDSAPEDQEDLSFQISKKAPDNEDTEKHDYDFSEVSCDDSLSDRQSRMLKLFTRIMLQIRDDPAYYGHGGVIETVMWNWDISPYKEELTPVFVDHLVDILSDYPKLGNDAVTIIESRLFKDISDPRIGVIYSKFKSLFPNGHNSYNRNHVFKVDVEKWFCGGKVFPKTGSNRFITYGNWIKKGKNNYFVLADDVLLFGKKYSLKYFIWEELSYSVDPASDKITIFAPDNSMLIEVQTGALEYMHFLDRLVTNKSRYIGEKVIDKSGFISNTDKYSRIFGKYSKKIKAGLIWVLILLGGFFISWLGFLDDSFFLDRHPFIEVLWVIIMLLSEAGSAIFFILFMHVIMQIVKVTSIFRIGITHMREFKKDIKDGKAEYVLGNKVFLFKRYIIYAITSGYIILPLDDIGETECIKAIPGKQSAKLKMVLRSGEVHYCDMNSETAIREVMTNILMRQLEGRKWS